MLTDLKLKCCELKLWPFPSIENWSSRWKKCKWEAKTVAYRVSSTNIWLLLFCGCVTVTAEAPGRPRSWRGTGPSGPRATPRTSCRRLGLWGWWVRPSWSWARLRVRIGTSTALGNTADPGPAHCPRSRRWGCPVWGGSLQCPLLLKEQWRWRTVAGKIWICCGVRSELWSFWVGVCSLLCYWQPSTWPVGFPLDPAGCAGSYDESPAETWPVTTSYWGDRHHSAAVRTCSSLPALWTWETCPRPVAAYHQKSFLFSFSCSRSRAGGCLLSSAGTWSLLTLFCEDAAVGRRRCIWRSHPARLWLYRPAVALPPRQSKPRLDRDTTRRNENNFTQQ